MKFEYPISVSNPEQKLGQNNTVGFFPIGRLFNWHGGIHVNERGTGAINAIGDGVVIAYRLAEKPIEINGLKVSNSFVLIRHKYTSPEGRYFSFFSLYNHLMTYDELKDQNKIPVLFEEKSYQIGGKIIEGLNIRSSSNKEDKYVVPLQMTVKVDVNLTEAEKKESHWAKEQPAYKKVIYTDPYTGEVFRDRFMYIGSKYNTKVDETTYKVTTIDGKRDKSDKKGENIRDISNGSVKFVVFEGTKIEIDGYVDDTKKYYKIKTIGGKAYSELKVWSKSVVEGDKILAEPQKFNDVVTGEECDIAVKAGEIIGFAGLNGFAGQEEYRSCHVEVFTDEDPSEFLKGISGDANDVEKTKKFIKIAKGANLSFKYPSSFKKDDKVKVLEYVDDEQDQFCKISLVKQVREVDYDSLDYITGTEKKKNNKVIAAKYKPEKLKALNTIFNHTLSKDSVLNWVATLDDIDGKKRRKVSYTPNGEYIYWVKKTDLGTSIKPTGQYTLPQDINTLFYKKPKNNKTDSSLEHDFISNKSEQEKNIVKIADSKWYKIKCITPVKNQNGFVQYQQIEGLIKSDDSKISKVSAFDWEAFGFKVYKDQPDTFVYHNSIQPLEKITPPAFLKSAWSHIDANGDGKLSSRELKDALQNQFAQQKLSKMICYHQSEWAIDFGSLKSEVEVLLDEGIELEEDDTEKQKLQEEKEIILNTVEQKIKAFNFWSNVKIAIPESISSMPDDWIYDPILNVSRKRYVWEMTYEKQETKEYKPFPKSNKVYHFHPIAFVEQMRRMTIRKRRDNNLGTLSSTYETGGRGTITVSTGEGDPGGISYGAYQLTSKPNGGNVKLFINSNDFKWKNSFENLTPGTSSFTSKWKELVNLHKEEFSNIEHEYIRREYFDVQINIIIEKLKIDLRYHSHSLNDVVWSTSVQHGSKTNVIINAIKNMDILHSETKNYDQKLIKLIYAERGKTEANGRLTRFPRVKKASVIQGLKDRFENEENKALKRLNNETDY